MGKGDRPEHSAPPELFYNDHEAVKYTTSSRIIEIQEKLTHRALELLLLEDNGCPKLILDIGCGSGLSGQVLTEQGVHTHAKPTTPQADANGIPCLACRGT
jgi:18S rRNA (guanine1575-N7)-methyltransferase